MSGILQQLELPAFLVCVKDHFCLFNATVDLTAAHSLFLCLFSCSHPSQVKTFQGRKMGQYV